MKKTFYYSDPLHDDFANTNGKIAQKKINAKYKYRHDNVSYKFFSFKQNRQRSIALHEQTFCAKTACNKWNKC